MSAPRPLSRESPKKGGRPKKYVNGAARTASWRARVAAKGVPERIAWAAMLRRCAAQGIAIYPDWQGEQGFENFLADMGRQPEGTTLVRIDDTFEFNPGNCFWATPEERQEYEKLNKRLRRRVSSRDSGTTCPIDEGAKRRLKPVVEADPTRTDAKHWNRVLASHGLTVKAGLFIKNAPRGRGLLVTGGWDWKKVQEVKAARDRVERLGGGRRVKPSGQDPRRYCDGEE